tara:strand:+ start:17844 stop:18155 length:312 start_codon:yes stop_codon:yes gene_type:complete
MTKSIHLADRVIKKIEDQMNSSVRLKINSFLPKEGKDNYNLNYNFISCSSWNISNQLWSKSGIDCSFLAWIKIPDCEDECFSIQISLKNNYDVFVGSIVVKEN